MGSACEISGVGYVGFGLTAECGTGGGVPGLMVEGGGKITADAVTREGCT